MTTPDQSQGEQPGEESAVTPASEQPQDETPKSIEDYSAEELLDALTAETPEPTAAPPAAEQAPAASEQPQQEQPEEEQPEPEAEKPKDPEEQPAGEQGSKAIRLRLNALPEDQQKEAADALRLVREGKASDLVEALQQLRGTTAQEQPTGQPEAEPRQETQDKPAPEKSGPVAEIEQKLADLRAQRKTAKAEFDTDTEEELTSQIENTLIELQDAKVQAATEATAQASWDQAYDDAVSELESTYPDALDDNSEFTEQLSIMVDAAKFRNDPALNDPRYILQFAGKVAKSLAPKQPGPPPIDPPRTPRATGKAVSPAQTQVSRPTADQVKARIDNASPDELLAALTST